MRVLCIWLATVLLGLSPRAHGQGFTQGGISGAYFANATMAGMPRLWLTPQGGSATSVISSSGTATGTHAGKFTLTAGQAYAVRFEFQDTASPAVARLEWAAPGRAAQPIEPAVNLGVNQTSLADWDGTRMFADAMKQSRGWCVVGSNCATLVPSDAQGWPTQDFLVIPVAGPPELNGTYLVQFQGLANVAIQFGYGTFSVAGTNYGGTLPSGAGYNAATNTTSALLTITPATGINVFINFTSTQRSAAAAVNTGITALHMMRPTAPGSATPYGPAQLFNGALEAVVSGFTTVRYMGYLDTNASTIANWGQRILPALPVQATPNGGALEYMVMFANETGKDVWLNLPVSANNDYVRKLAQLLRYGSDGVTPYTAPQANPVFPPLQPNLDVYVEYSNEVWNFSFAQAETNLKLAEAEVPHGSPLNYDGSTNQYYWGWRRVALRGAQISNIFRSVWGGAAMGNAIRPVLEWQIGNGQDTADQELGFLADYFDNADGLPHVATPHPASYYFWGGGGAWYHTVNDPGASSIDAIYASGLILPTSVTTDAEWAQTFGLREAGYEGGFEIGGDTPTALELSANLAAQAQGSEAYGLNYFFAQGGGIGLIFNVAGASAYGLADPTVYDSDTPKLAAVAGLMAGGAPAVTLGNPVGGTTSLPTTSADVAHDLYGPFGTTVYVGAGSWLNWTIYVATPGTYGIATNLGSVTGEEIDVDGVGLGNSGTTAILTAGLHGIRVRNLASTGSLALTSLNLSLQ